MKKIFLMGLIALGVILTGCSKDDVDNGNGNGNGNTLKGYLTLSIQGTQAMGQFTEPGGDGTEPGSTAENQIHNVTVIFTDANGLITNFAKPTIDANNKTDKISIETGTHYVYTLVNDPGIAIAVNQNIDRVIDVATATDATTGYKAGKFLMVNERHNSTSKGGEEAIVSAAHTEDAPLSITVTVDRVAAKVRMEDNAPTVTDLAASTENFITGVEVKGFTILNVNKQFNLLQTWGKTNGSEADLTADALVTPLASADPVSDQYFYNISEYATIVKDGTGKMTELIDKTLESTTSVFATTDVYVTENRPAIKAWGGGWTAGQKETTGVIYQVQAKGAAGNLPTFYVVNGKTYATLAEVQALELFKDEVLSGYTIPQLRGLGIEVYENGIMYYTYFIKDPNSSHRLDAKDYYGIFRNSIYNLKITKISYLGDQVPGGGTVDPEEPGTGPDVDTDETYIDVTVEVNPWVLNNIDIEL